MPNVQPITADAFARHLNDNSSTPIVLDLHASWCGPCRALAPVLEKMAEKLAGRVRFFKADVEQQPDLARDHRVTAVPTLVVFVNGREVDRLTGFQPPALLEDRISRHIAAPAV